jgi:hypothetical protein
MVLHHYQRSEPYFSTCWGQVKAVRPIGIMLRPSWLRPLVSSTTLIKKKIKFSSYIGKFRVEQLQSHIWLTASLYIGKYFLISSYNRKTFLIYDLPTAPLWISLYMRKILFYFLSVYRVGQQSADLGHFDPWTVGRTQWILLQLTASPELGPFLHLAHFL